MNLSEVSNDELIKEVRRRKMYISPQTIIKISKNNEETIDTILDNLQRLVQNITREAKKRLKEDERLLQSIFSVVSNLSVITNNEFSIVGIKLDDDPEVEPPLAIIILIGIKYNDYKKISEVKDRIYEISYLGIDRSYRNEMYIIDVGV